MLRGSNASNRLTACVPANSVTPLHTSFIRLTNCWTLVDQLYICRTVHCFCICPLSHHIRIHLYLLFLISFHLISFHWIFSEYPKVIFFLFLFSVYHR